MTEQEIKKAKSLFRWERFILLFCRENTTFYYHAGKAYGICDSMAKCDFLFPFERWKKGIRKKIGKREKRQFNKADRIQKVMETFEPVKDLHREGKIK